MHITTCSDFYQHQYVQALKKEAGLKLIQPKQVNCRYCEDIIENSATFISLIYCYKMGPSSVRESHSTK